MKSLLRQYLITAIVSMFAFTQFIACGSQLYQVSLEDDLAEENLSQAATDPSSATYGIHTPGGWATLPIQYKFGSGLDDMQRKALTKAIETWEKAIGKTLFSFQGTHDQTTGDTFSDLYSSLNDPVNGTYLDFNWGKTKKKTVVLATAIWDGTASNINTADLRFNAENYLIGDSLIITSTDEKDVVDMQSLALHEIGHMIGLAHVASDIDYYSVMNPSLYIGERLTTRKPSQGDIERIQKIYGCEGDACDLEEITLAIEQNIDQDEEVTLDSTESH